MSWQIRAADYLNQRARPLYIHGEIGGITSKEIAIGEHAHDVTFGIDHQQGAHTYRLIPPRPLDHYRHFAQSSDGVLPDPERARPESDEWQ
jgi:hypothetical protein